MLPETADSVVRLVNAYDLPLSVVLSYGPSAGQTQSAPDMDSGDEQDAADAVDALESEDGTKQSDDAKK